jgi:DNA-binding NtrC family response regulator
MRPDPTRCLLLIDDEPAQRRLVSAICGRAGWWVRGAADAESAAQILTDPEEPKIDAILLDHWMSGEAGNQLIAELKALRPELPLLVVTAQTCVSVAVDAMRAGAADFLVKPIAPDRLLAALDSATDRRKSSGELRPLSEKISKQLGFEEIVGSAPEFRAALAVAAKAARSRASILIEGESGSGKEIFAQAIHAASPRGKRAMITVNCGAIPANLVESVLFGHEKGAFTGAFDRHIGRFEDADGSTIFLDEVGELPLETQVKLLRALEDGEIQRIGGRITQTVDVRVIAATNRRLAEEVAAGRFREDLYYRLNVVHVALPPLRDRISDLPPLARHLLARIAEQPGIPSRGALRGRRSDRRRFPADRQRGPLRQPRRRLSRHPPQRRLGDCSARARRRHHPLCARREPAPARGDRGGRDPPRHRPLSGADDGGRPPPRNRPLDPLSQARRARHRRRRLELSNAPIAATAAQ